MNLRMLVRVAVGIIATDMLRLMQHMNGEYRGMSGSNLVMKIDWK